jgi:hypothetical protein
LTKTVQLGEKPKKIIGISIWNALYVNKSSGPKQPAKRVSAYEAGNGVPERVEVLVSQAFICLPGHKKPVCRHFQQQTDPFFGWAKTIPGPFCFVAGP